jgi:hypothetical protein
MSAFKGTSSDQQLHDVVAYIGSLGKRGVNNKDPALDPETEASQRADHSSNRPAIHVAT